MAERRELSPYPGEDERERELEELCAEGGGVVEEIGRSVEGRPIRAARLPAWSPSSSPSPSSSSPPRVLVNANIHGPEWIGARVAMGVLRALAEAPAAAGTPSAAATLRAAAEVVVIPCVNVDGWARTEGCSGRGTLKALRTNAHGVDLNRNFPVPAVPSTWIARTISARFAGSGSGDPRRATFRGTGPLSEPEAAALDAFCARERFVACASLHSFMGTCIPPCVRTREESRGYALLARAVAGAQARRRYRRLASRLVDVTTGELEDRLHHELGCWAMTIECFTVLQSVAQHLHAPSLFWRFNPHDPAVVVDNDVPGVLAFLRAALALPHPARTPNR